MLVKFTSKNHGEIAINPGAVISIVDVEDGVCINMQARLAYVVDMPMDEVIEKLESGSRLLVSCLNNMNNLIASKT